MYIKRPRDDLELKMDAEVVGKYKEGYLIILACFCLSSVTYIYMYTPTFNQNLYDR